MKFFKWMKDSISVNLSFYILFFFVIALGYSEQFFIMLVSVTLHELTHALTAKQMRLKTNKLTFSALGERVEIKNIRSLSRVGQLIIFLSGPAVNLLLAFFGFIIAGKNFFCYSNLFLGLFNLLPIYPLDGGHIFELALKNMPAVKKNKLIMRISLCLSLMLMCLGLVQVVLYPYNISLFCLGVFFYKANRTEYVYLTLEFYSYVLYEKHKTPPMLPIRSIAVDGDCSIKALFGLLNRDCYYMVYVLDEGSIVQTITEKEIVDYILRHGFYCKVSEMYTCGRSFGEDIGLSTARAE